MEENVIISPTQGADRVWVILDRLLSKFAKRTRRRTLTTENDRRQNRKVEEPPAISLADAAEVSQFCAKTMPTVQGGVAPPPFPEAAGRLADRAHNTLRRDPTEPHAYGLMTEKEFEKLVKKKPQKFWIMQACTMSGRLSERLADVLHPVQLVPASEHAIGRLPQRRIAQTE